MHNSLHVYPDTFTTPCYIADTLLGCYRIRRPDTQVTNDQARQRCSSDGGRLLLINSEAEANRIIKPNTYLTLDKARKLCASDGGRLLLVKSETEANQLWTRLCTLILLFIML